jgi:hypothetical protein
MKKKKIVKWFGFFILIFGLVEYWRIKDIGKEINKLDINSECYQNNDFIEYNNYSCGFYFINKISKGLSDDKEYEFCETRHSREKEKVEEIIRFKNKLLQDQKKLQNRKIFACRGWNGFRTAIFIADEKDNLLYYYRDISPFGTEWVPENFARPSIDDEYIGWSGGPDGGPVAPLHPNLLQRIDAKIIQWLVELFY